MSATPHHVDHVALWSVAAAQFRSVNPTAEPQRHFHVEHGTPRRQFARLVLDDENMRLLVEQRWKLAVITIEEDRRLNARFRSHLFDTPEARWAAAGIVFQVPEAATE